MATRALRRLLSSSSSGGGGGGGAAYRTPAPPSTRLAAASAARHATGPYELPGAARGAYPKRRSPYRRSSALIHALQREEALRLQGAQRAVLAARLPQLRAGAVLRVGYARHASAAPRGGEQRLQWFTGICVAVRRRGLGGSVLLRNVVQGVAVERLFPLYSPLVREVHVVGKKRAKRAKLYYLRDKPLKESTVPNATRPPPEPSGG